jgi:hypothetical protein
MRDGYSYYGYGGSEDVPGVANGGAAGGSTSTSPAPTHSDTETQVKGVDEADIVKADGTQLYVLHGSKLMVVDAWPAPSMGAASAADIEGQPSEMFVTNGQAVVFSTVDGAPIYAATGIAPRPQYDDSYGGPGYYGGGGVAIGTPVGGGGYGGGNSWANPLTKVTVLALDASGPRVTRELYFEGSYLSSRRVDSRVRIVLEGGAHGPKLNYNPTTPQSTPSSMSIAPGTADAAAIAAWEQLRLANEAVIAATTYADWIPDGFARDGSGVHLARTACTDFYVPSIGTTESGMTQIEAIDLNAPSDPPRASAIVGAVDTVYGDTTSMVLAAHAYVDPWLTRQTFGPAPANVVIPVAPTSYTHLHLFDLSSDPSQALYAGSGTVPGNVKDQFALDQKNGTVRVTTTVQYSGPARADGLQNEASHVYALTNDAGRLYMSGDSGEIAPGEQLYATRFVGDKAYIVTWHVTDPLFVVDVSDPARVHVMGQVQIPGFSEYIHPLDDTHLLTIGRETDDTGHQHTTGGYWYGLAIQVFDVTNPLSPALLQKYVYDGGDYATSEATQNHKAFTYFDDRQLLAFPYVRQYGYGTDANTGPSSTLEVFKIDVANGITKVGSVDQTPLMSTLPNGNYGWCGGYFDGSVRRGVFFSSSGACGTACSTVVYSISYGGILANDITNLATPLSTLRLPAPALNGVSCPGGG